MGASSGIKEKKCRPPERAGSVSLAGMTKADMWSQSVAVPRDPAAVVVGPDVLLVSEKEAARMLGVSRRTVFELNEQRVLTARRIGKRKMYSVETLKKFVESGAA